MSREDIQVTDIMRISLLANLKDAEVASLLEVASIDAFQPGQFIFREGDFGSAICMIIFGSVKICKNSPDGKMYEIAQIHETDFFGEMSFLDVDSKTRSANAVAGAETHILSFTEESFRAFVIRHAHAAFRFLRNIALELQKRLKNSNAKLVKNYDDLMKSHNSMVEYRNFLGSVIGCTSDIVIVIDAAERITMFNYGAELNLKINFASVAGRSPEPFFFDGQYRQIINEVFAARGVCNREIYLKACDGTQVHAVFTAFGLMAQKDGRQFYEFIALIARPLPRA